MDHCIRTVCPGCDHAVDMHVIAEDHAARAAHTESSAGPEIAPCLETQTAQGKPNFVPPATGELERSLPRVTRLAKRPRRHRCYRLCLDHRRHHKFGIGPTIDPM